MSTRNILDDVFSFDDEEQVEKVNAAVDLLIDFEEALARADLLNKF